MLQQFKLCLDAAVRDGLIKTNPAAHTKTPQPARKRVTASDVLSAEELVRLVAAVQDQYKALVYLSGWLGWRWSEAMGLRLCDVMCCRSAHPSTPLFTTGNGETPYRSNFRRVFQRAVRDAGLENRKINMRQLRHTAASLMLSSGLDILDVQERLGHARGSITLDVYGRVLAGRRTEGTRRMSEVMARNSNIGFTS
jgi:integrase